MNKPTNISASRTAKLVKVGNSTGIILPKEILAQLRVGQGDTVYLLDTPDGVRLSTVNPDFAKKMDMAEQIMRDDRNILRELAK